MNWERLFQRHILDRGYDYYMDERVNDLSFSDKTIEAVVEGSEEYAVKIMLSDEKVTDMFCSCPYAADGTPCKHMAAVLYEYDEAVDEQSNAEEPGKNHVSSKPPADTTFVEPTIEEMVASADEDLVRRFLLEALNDDEKLTLRFRSLCNPVISVADLKKYKQRIIQLIRSYQGRGGFIDYRSASPFMNEMIGEMNDSLENMMNIQCYSAAFELAAYTFIQVSDVDMDDSDGELSWFAEECEEWWERILDEAEQFGQTNVQEIMYDWFAGHLNGSIIDYMEEHVESFLKTHFNQERFQRKKLALVDEKISEYDSKTDSSLFDYHLGSWLVTRIEMMEEMGCPWDETKVFCKQYWNHRSVRNWYAKACADRGDIEEEIFTLERSLLLDSSYAGLVSEYSLRLKDLYKESGRLQDYQNIMWKIVTQNKPGDLALFREFKTQFGTEEWLEVREKVFKSLSAYHSSLMKLYLEEGMLDRLMNEVLSTGGLHSARLYKNVLLPLYPSEYLDIYAKEAEQSAMHVSNRQHYRELADLLLEIRELPGGQQKSAEIEKHWREAYGNRRAMMDELNKMYQKRKNIRR